MHFLLALAKSEAHVLAEAKRRRTCKVWKDFTRDAKRDWPYAVVALVMLALLICRMAVTP